MRTSCHSGNSQRGRQYDVHYDYPSVSKNLFCWRRLLLMALTDVALLKSETARNWSCDIA